MTARNIPAVFWDRVILWCCEVCAHLALNHPDLEGEVPWTVLTGEEAPKEKILYDKYEVEDADRRTTVRVNASCLSVEEARFFVTS